MIKNPEFIQNKFECNKVVADWLVYKMGLPILAIKNKRYYFIYDYKMYYAIRAMPIWIKIIYDADKIIVGIKSKRREV